MVLLAFGRVDIDIRDKTVTAKGRREKSDTLILAVGAGPVLLPFVSQFPEDVIPIWRAGR